MNYHPERAEAEAKYAIALRKWQIASNGADENAVDAAYTELQLARKAAVELEIKYPTRSESKRAERKRNLANRGIDN